MAAQPLLPLFKYSTIKEISDSGDLSSLPSCYSCRGPDIDGPTETLEEEVPIIDFSLLVGGTAKQRTQVIQDLGKACRDWGFFMVVNHGVPKSLMETMLNACMGFFNMREDVKQEYNGKHVFDPISHGTSFNSSVDNVRYWRDYLKVIVHPHFHSPAKPSGFRETSIEYATQTREMAKELLKAIWESLELKPEDMEEALDLNSCFQILVTNLYPPCPQPELALGIPPHSDHGLLTILLENGVNGLKVEHNGKWVHVKSLPNSFLVNTGDHMEIVSNGKYKSVVHQAEVNASSTRISIATAVGPSLDTVVVPAPQLVKHKHQLAYKGMKYRDFREHTQANPRQVKSLLDLLRLHN
ncbi:hypothetical protein J5N97_001439 [Dioscorea zingiberensis]|uniref:Fe2OG dioxygenase domain-containing protein n=1 Tax=Dioscorea zingiberensis TaxID=325984 RepID=A0A9D5BU65_9LILI|nr:hypothetical protein J5N97_001439 [Dioscorea zingiberensis]